MIRENCLKREDEMGIGRVLRGMGGLQFVFTEQPPMSLLAVGGCFANKICKIPLPKSTLLIGGLQKILQNPLAKLNYLLQEGPVPCRASTCQRSTLFTVSARASNLSN